MSLHQTNNVKDLTDTNSGQPSNPKDHTPRPIASVHVSNQPNMQKTLKVSYPTVPVKRP